jgi:hypothetical protein
MVYSAAKAVVAFFDQIKKLAGESSFLQLFPDTFPV